MKIHANAVLQDVDIIGRITSACMYKAYRCGGKERVFFQIAGICLTNIKRNSRCICIDNGLRPGI